MFRISVKLTKLTVLLRGFSLLSFTAAVDDRDSESS